MTPLQEWRVSSTRIFVALLFLLALIASPSIFRGWVSDYLIDAVSIALILALAARGRICRSVSLLTSWGIVFSLMVASTIHLAGLGQQTSTALAGIFSLMVLLLVYDLLSDKRFSKRIIGWWRGLFSVVAVLSILTWILSYAAPGLFKDIEYGQLYSGNVRTYSVFLTGAFINQDYGSVALHRVVGVMAEPGMMSMLFAINACLGLVYKNSYFSRTFGTANLMAGFTTHSVAYYLVISILGSYLLLRCSHRFVRVIGLLVAIVISVIGMGTLLELVGVLLERSSYHSREGGVLSLMNNVLSYPMAVFFGPSWAGITAQFPSTALHLFYQCGIIGVLAYFMFIARFARRMPEISIIFLGYAMSLEYHTYFIVALALMVVRAFHVSNVAASSANAGHRSVPRSTAGEGITVHR